MTRFTGSSNTEVGQVVVHPALLVNILGNFWTQNDAPVVWNAQTYTPFPFAADGIDETTSTDTHMLQISIQATPDNIALTRASGHVWSPMSATIVFVKADGTVMDGVIQQAYLGKVVASNITHDKDNSAIVIVCQDLMSLMERASGMRFNTQDQQSRPGCSTDTIFDALPKMQGRDVRWLQKPVAASSFAGGGGGGGGSGGRSIRIGRAQR